MHDGSFKAGDYAIFIAEDGVSRKQRHNQSNGHYDKHASCNPESTVFFRSNFGIGIFCYIDIVIQRISFPKPRFRDFFSNIPAASNYRKGRSETIEIVAQYVYLVAGINQLSSALSKALDNRVNCRRSIVSRKSTCNTCERSSDTGQRMFAGSVEHIRRNRDDDYITGIRTNMAKHTSQNDNRGQEELGSDGKQFFQTSIDKTGTISNADTQSSNDYHAKGRETCIIANHFTEKQYDVFTTKHIINNNVFTSCRMHIIKMHLRKNCGDYANQHKSTYEQNGNIRNFIADTFDKTKNAANLLFFLSSFHSLINSFTIFTHRKVL